MRAFYAPVTTGFVTNKRNGESRKGWWIRATDIPKAVRAQLGMLELHSDEGMAWDLQRGAWRNMKNAQPSSMKVCTTALVQFDDRAILALLDT